MDSPLTVKAVQQLIRDRYFATDNARGPEGTFLWFVEEVGELATAISNHARGRSPSESERENLGEEFADVVAWLCTLANITGVDLEAEIRRKYVAGGGPAGAKH